MKYRLLIISLIAVLTCIVSNTQAENRGIPFIRNFSAQEYKAQNGNTDVACDDNGNVFFANFECVLYYDGAIWRKVYGPNKESITHIVRDKKRNKIWVGGNNLFGYLTADKDGVLRLKPVFSANSHSKMKLDWVKWIDIDSNKNHLYIYNEEDSCFILTKGNTLKPCHGRKHLAENTADNAAMAYCKKIHVSKNPDGGLLISDGTRHRTITENDGLCSNNVEFYMFNQRNLLWGATDYGVFGMEIPSPYSHLTENQGLAGEVKTINEIGQDIYVGTLKGLYKIVNGKVTKVRGIDTGCWELKSEGSDALLASTGNGLFRITKNSIRQITKTQVYASAVAPQGGYFTGEFDGLYYNDGKGARKNVAPEIKKGTKIDARGSLIEITTVDRDIWDYQVFGRHKAVLRKKQDSKNPMIFFTDRYGRKWETNGAGDSLHIKNTRDSNLKKWIHPFLSYNLNAAFCSNENALWVGGDFGVVSCDLSLIGDVQDTNETAPVLIRQVRAGQDTLWGGFYGDGLKALSYVGCINLPTDCHDLRIDFSTRYMSFFCPEKYRYRLRHSSWLAWLNGYIPKYGKDEDWGKWTNETNAFYHNLSYGMTAFDVEALDLFGNVSEISTVEIYMEYPFYLRWYAIIIYIICFVGIIRWFINYREAKLERDKAQLESIVNKRTAELSTTLDELQRTQEDLVRMERTATAGKLTSGLIDRILNPINYINNFSKLTKGLAKDLHDDIEDEKDNMSEDNYEDCEDVLDMMNQNLTKIEEHGVNATRTLRAMEAMLNTKVGAMKTIDMSSLCKQIYEAAADYYKEDISNYKISFTHKIPKESVEHDIDQESISNAIKAMLGNAFYAVIKKTQREPYDANVELRLAKLSDNHIEIIIHDNGIGIEDSIKEKVFDPFFTTKTTGEASGVGMYLAREIIQDHKGTLTLESQKDEFTNFIISL